MSTAANAEKPLQLPPGRLIIEYLQECALANNSNGATLSDIVQHLSEEHGERPTEDLNMAVQSVLDNGAALGFLERKGSHFITYLARGMRCGRRRRRSRCRRRRRRSRCRRRRRSRCRRKRKCSRRRRRKRCGC
ncbi:unnamed protein product [Leptosia nina]|uniref:H15 domain-containing protein n=1 Tax=Leptosia nina TaxID=320188 RepID=A0AAV1JZH7_9NEOP